MMMMVPRLTGGGEGEAHRRPQKRSPSPRAMVIAALPALMAVCAGGGSGGGAATWKKHPTALTETNGT